MCMRSLQRGECAHSVSSARGIACGSTTVLTRIKLLRRWKNRTCFFFFFNIYFALPLLILALLLELGNIRIFTHSLVLFPPFLNSCVSCGRALSWLWLRFKKNRGEQVPDTVSSFSAFCFLIASLYFYGSSCSFTCHMCTAVEMWIKLLQKKSNSICDSFVWMRLEIIQCEWQRKGETLIILCQC